MGKGHCWECQGLYLWPCGFTEKFVSLGVHLPFASSSPSSLLLNLMSQGSVVLRLRLSCRGVSNFEAGMDPEGDSTYIPECKG